MFSSGDRVYCWLGSVGTQEGEIEVVFEVLTPQGKEQWALVNWDCAGVVGAMPSTYLSHV